MDNLLHVFCGPEKLRLLDEYFAAVEQLRKARIALDDAGIRYDFDTAQFEDRFNLPPGLLAGELNLAVAFVAVDRWHGPGTLDAMTKGEQ